MAEAVSAKDEALKGAWLRQIPLEEWPEKDGPHFAAALAFAKAWRDDPRNSWSLVAHGLVP